jgi:hypothetical protein
MPNPVPDDESLSCNVRLDEVAVYQAVKIALGVRGQGGDAVAPRSPRNADLVAGREALVRAFLNTPAAPERTQVRARLTLRSSRGTTVVTRDATLFGSSSEARIASTVNFHLGAGALRDDTVLMVELEQPKRCPISTGRTRFPRDGELALVARRTGNLSVRLVPIAYDGDGSGRLPDLSESQLARYRDVLLSMFPVTDVVMEVRKPVRATQIVSPDSGWGDLLDSVRQLRQDDKAPAEVHYYGLINPDDSFDSYCGRGCTAGIAYVSGNERASLRVGVGIGFPGPYSAQTLVHEMGHESGRLHAPCNVDGDPDFPYSTGKIGIWGYDLVDGRVMDPDVFGDIMGYCSPTWVSDYTYQALIEHLARVNAAMTERTLDLVQTWRALLVDASGATRWGAPLHEAATGTKELAEVVDVTGQTVTWIEVHRTIIADSGSYLVLVPEPSSGWHAVKVAGARAAHPFAARVETPRLVR